MAEVQAVPKLPRYVPFHNVENDLSGLVDTTVTFVLRDGTEVDASTTPKVTGDVVGVVLNDEFPRRYHPVGHNLSKPYHEVKLKWDHRVPFVLGVAQIYCWPEHVKRGGGALRGHTVVWDAALVPEDVKPNPNDHHCLHFEGVNFTNALFKFASPENVQLHGPYGSALPYKDGEPVTGFVECLALWPKLHGPGVGPVEFPKVFRFHDGAQQYSNEEVEFSKVTKEHGHYLLKSSAKGKHTHWVAPLNAGPSLGLQTQ